MMQSFSFGEDWLLYIKFDIKQKYAIENPIFFIENKAEAITAPDKWINDQLKQGNWVLYKKLKTPNEFELIATAPNPPDNVCTAIATNFINHMKTHYKTNSILFKIGDSCYGEKTALTELFNLLKEGSSVIYASPKSSKVSDNDNPKIVDVWVTEDEMDIQLELGYLTLEYME